MSDYSRVRSRRAFRDTSEKRKADKLSVKHLRPSVPWGLIIVISVLVSVFSVANPFLKGLADSQQSQGIYAGLAMLAGKAPYSDFYGESGLVYYLLMLLGSFFGNGIGLMIVQSFLLLFSGATFYKLVHFLTGSKELARHILQVFYLVLAVLGWGGLYASLFALPFVLNGLLFLVRYLSDETIDEGFILYGVNGVFAFLIDPRSALLWGVAAVVLFVYNIKNKRWARGFYQWLASILGSSFILSAAGYYMLSYQTLGLAIEQTLLLPLQTLTAWSNNKGEQLLLMLAFLLGTGLLMPLVYGVISLARPHHRTAKVLMYIALWGQLFICFLSPRFSSASLIALVPYALVLIATYMCHSLSGLRVRGLDEEVTEVQVSREELLHKPLSFWKLNGFIPLLSVVYLVAYPAWTMFTQQSLILERQEVAEYVREYTGSTERIYAWDNRATIYQDSERLAASFIVTPDVILQEKQQEALETTLMKDTASFVVVNVDLTLPETLKEYFQETYQEETLNLSHFKVYKRK